MNNIITIGYISYNKIIPNGCYPFWTVLNEVNYYQNLEVQGLV